MLCIIPSTLVHISIVCSKNKSEVYDKINKDSFVRFDQVSFSLQNDKK